MTTKENSKPRIGFIGMGHMGSHMASRLLDAGYPLTVYDRTREKAQAIGQRGAVVAQTPKDLAASCEVIIYCTIFCKKVTKDLICVSQMWSYVKITTPKKCLLI